MSSSFPKTAFITGASRGVGASIALQLAQRGVQTALNYREKSERAQKVADQIQAMGVRAILAGADITDAAQMRLALQKTHEELGELDWLFLNASGGLERNQAPDYALLLNRNAQIQTLELALPFLKPGARVVFVTSHLAHFWGEKPVPETYEPVAQSKKAGEIALREQIPALQKRQVSLIVVSGDAIEGTITLKILARKNRGAANGGAANGGAANGDAANGGAANGDARDANRVLPTIEEFAGAIVEAAFDPSLESGATIFVGATE